jgi:hypothetical protein
MNNFVSLNIAHTGGNKREIINVFKRTIEGSWIKE